mmetsp:Transcript_7314/g.11125  ORF Transcript_7314/g.11125 Transcript_7314/m.11125 type:complete len:339 (-) Transcript_7314:705-1721(-)
MMLIKASKSVFIAAAILVYPTTNAQIVPSTVSFQDDFPSLESFEEISWITLRHYSYGSNDESNFFDGYGKVFSVLWDAKTKQDTDVVLLMAPESERIYLAFRGTEVEDVGTILNFALEPYGDPSSTNVTFPAGKVHKGFNTNLFGTGKLYLTLDAIISAAMEQYANYQLVILGHSLGGALAILYGAHVAKNLMPDKNILVQSIGTPRVGDKTFKSSLRQIKNLANWRVVYKLDAIPRIPLNNQGYQHAGHLIYLNGNSAAAYFEQTGDLDKYAGVGANDFLLPAIPIADHYPSSYILGLAEAKEKHWWPTQFVPYEVQEKVCCGWFFIWCYRKDYPPC